MCYSFLIVLELVHFTSRFEIEIQAKLFFLTETALYINFQLWFPLANINSIVVQ